MKYGAVVGWAVVIYAVMALAWSGFITYGLAGTLTARVLQLLVLVIVTTIAARSLKFHSWKDILPYSILWAVMMGLLDIVFTVPFAGWEIYADWNIWVGYTLVVIIPLLAPFTRGASVSREG